MTARRRFLAASALSAAFPCPLLAAAAAADCAPGATALTAAQASADVKILKRTLLALHPALTKYRTQAEIDAAVAEFEAAGQAARSPGAMYLAATRLAAAIRCGHTWTNVLNQSSGAKATLLEQADKLPLQLTLVAGRWLVLASADPAVAAGDEVLAVDGVPAAAMVERLMPYLRADGSSDNKRLRQLCHDRDDYSQIDILWPLLQPPRDGTYTLELVRPAGGRGDVTAGANVREPAREPVRVTVRASTLAARKAALAAAGVQVPPAAWTFKVNDRFAVLTMPSWSVWNSKFDWAAFVDASFATLQRERVPALVIDIRANEGGDGAVGNRVLSHLLTKPLSYLRLQNVTMYERVPYALARHLDTWDDSFFDRTGDVARITEGTAAGKYRVLSKQAAPGVIQPVDQPYRGKTYVLTGGENSSATFVFADLAQRTGAATLVGQVTGGNQRGLNGGELAWVNLPNSGVAVDIPLLAAAYAADTPDASVTPDVLVQPTLAARRAGRDLELETVARSIAAGR